MRKALMQNRSTIAIAAVVTHLCLGSVYAWSIFVPPILNVTPWTVSQVTWAFSVAIATLGLTAAFAGPLMQKLGPSKCVGLSATLVGLGLVGCGLAIRCNSLPMLYGMYGIVGGHGLGMGYVPPVTTLMRWFADRRGLATGLAVGGFGIGALLASYLGQWLLGHWSCSATFIIMGLIYWPILFVASRFLHLPETVKTSGPAAESISARQVLTQPRFWLLWGAFFVNIATGILLIALARPMLQGTLGFSDAAAISTVALMGLFNGVGRFAWSAASDRLGRSTTWFIMLTLQLAMFTVLAHTGSGLLFAAGLCLILSCYGGGFAICPAMVGDIFGSRSAARVYGLSLTAWSAAALLSPPVTAAVKKATGSYTPVLTGCAATTILGLLLILGLHMVTRKKASLPALETANVH